MRATKLTFILITSILMLICVCGCYDDPLRSSGNTIFIKGKDNAPMVRIKEGEFMMGSHTGEFQNDPVDLNQFPEHTVYLDAFYIDVKEVTNAQYRKFVDATGHPKPKYWDAVWEHEFDIPHHPVVGVNWFDATAYAEWAGKRLPTEAEWEKAARGGLVGEHFPWGGEISSDNANAYGIGYLDVWEKASPVGRFKPNGYGLYDMAGNVREWCADWYDHDSCYYMDSPHNNPLGPESGLWRVLRGGGWNDLLSYLRVSHRVDCSPSEKDWDVGFRCAAD